MDNCLLKYATKAAYKSDGLRVRKEVKAKRGCGYRVAGGIYLVGLGMILPCDRLPLTINFCSTCGELPRPIRGYSIIDAGKLFGYHGSDVCIDSKNCVVCYPPLDIPSLLMWVGQQYTIESFIDESSRMGVSKRIGKVPKNLEVGKTVVYLARRGISKIVIGTDAIGKKVKANAVFYAFIPNMIEVVMNESDASKSVIEEWNEKGVCVVTVPDNDPDHHGRGTPTPEIIVRNRKRASLRKMFG